MITRIRWDTQNICSWDEIQVTAINTGMNLLKTTLPLLSSTVASTDGVHCLFSVVTSLRMSTIILLCRSRNSRAEVLTRRTVTWSWHILDQSCVTYSCASPCAVNPTLAVKLSLPSLIFIVKVKKTNSIVMWLFLLL